MSGPEDIEASRHGYKKPHSGRNPIPTVQQYRDNKRKQQQELAHDDSGNLPLEAKGGDSLHNDTWSEAARKWWSGTENNDARRLSAQDSGEEEDDGPEDSFPNAPDHETTKDTQLVDTVQDTSQATPAQGVVDPKQKRKLAKRTNASRAERQVTDPVTHLPVTIHDYTGQDLTAVGEEGRDDDNDGVDDANLANDTDPGATGLKDKGRTPSALEGATTVQRREHGELYHRFPPPRFDEARNELAQTQRQAAALTLVSVVFFVFLVLVIELFIPDHILTLGHRIDPRFVLGFEALLTVILTLMSISVVQTWTQKQAEAIWDDAVWHAQKLEARKTLRTGSEETTLWLSKLIGSIWPLVNPDLFTGLGDTLEDVMQASLPRMVRMVSVEDIGQGSEPLRVLGVKWLPKGAASRTVEDGKNLQRKNEIKQQQQDRQTTDKDSPDAEDDSKAAKEDRVQVEDSHEGMEAEEGDFVNMEIAFAYRASRFQKRFKGRQKNAHMLLAFYLPGNLNLPVWVELRGIVGSCRVRLQLTPDPPFVALCTLTFLGQPKVDMTCVPLIRKGLDIMDLPLISNFVQSSIDAAFSEYIAPKSVPLDLQAMLAGDDFKKDTAARGVIVCHFRRAFDFKASDMSMPLVGKEKSSDAYLTVSWAKFGKPLWSSRIIMADMKPYWEEKAFILVSPEELDAEESLRVQLWDSDKFSADDDLGRIELVLKDLMKDEHSNGRMWDRSDSFKALEAGKGMPGTLDWSVGYFSKARLQESQMKQQCKDKHVENVEQLKQQVYQRAERKLRETAKNESAEMQQLKDDDWENEQRNIISSSVPPEEFPSGILSIQVHQIVGLSVENTRKNKSPEEEDEDGENNDEDQLPSSYCTVILNDQKIFRTRTKPKNSAPFFNACTERFIRDWQNAIVLISVRDQRVHEDNALLGHVYLNIGDLFQKHKSSCINSFWPIAGGIGYGRLRVSVVFRSTSLDLPRRELGWDTGVVEVAPEAFATKGTSKDVRGHRVKVRTNTSKGQMRSVKLQNATTDVDATCAKWATSKHRSLLLAVRKRYASNLVLEFRASSSGLLPKSKRCVAFSIAWLKDVVDEEWTELNLPIYTDRDELLKRAVANVLPQSELSASKIGELRIRLKLWRGLGRAHNSLAKRNTDVSDILEVRDSAHELGSGPAIVGAKGWRQERGLNSSWDGAGQDEGDDSDSDSSDDDDQSHSGAEQDTTQGDDDDSDRMNKIGQLAQHARRKIPFTKAHQEAKSGEREEAEAAAGIRQPESESTKKSNFSTGESASHPGQSESITGTLNSDKVEFNELDTKTSQQAPSAPHASVGPVDGASAVRDSLQSPDSPFQPDQNKTEVQGGGAAIDRQAESGESGFDELDTKTSQQASSAPQASVGPERGPDGVNRELHSSTTAGDGPKKELDQDEDAAQDQVGREDYGHEISTPRISTSQKANYSIFPKDNPYAPGTPTHSRPTTATTSASNECASTPTRSSHTPSANTPNASFPSQRDSATPSPDSSVKRRSGVLGSIKRSFSLRNSPLSKSEAKKDKRASRVFSDNTGSSSNVRSSGSRPTSTFYDRSPLSSHPTASSSGTATDADGSPTKSRTNDSRTSMTPSSSHAYDDAAQVGNDGEGGGSDINGNDKDDASNSTREQLHRRHRGIMQFKGPRTANWVKHKAENAMGEIQRGLKHEEREKTGGVETEV